MNDRIAATSVEKMPPVVEVRGSDFWKTIGAGMTVGFITSVLYFLLSKFVFGSILCRAESMERCGEVAQYAMPLSLLIGAIVGLIMLAQMRIYRPLLIVIAATIALWGYQVIVANMAWYFALLASLVLFGVIYALYAWLARLRSFVFSVVIIVVVTVIIRLVMVS